jgi:hypothetical protein
LLQLAILSPCPQITQISQIKEAGAKERTEQGNGKTASAGHWLSDFRRLAGL